MLSKSIAKMMHQRVQVSPAMRRYGKRIVAHVMAEYCEFLGKRISTRLLRDYMSYDVELWNDAPEHVKLFQDTIDELIQDGMREEIQNFPSHPSHSPTQRMGHRAEVSNFLGGEINFLTGLYSLLDENLDNAIRKHTDKTCKPTDGWQLAANLEIEVAVLRGQLEKFETEANNGKQLQKNCKAFKQAAKDATLKVQSLTEELHTAQVKVSAMRGSLDEAQRAKARADKIASDCQYEMELLKRRHELEMAEYKRVEASRVNYEDLFKRERV